MTTLHVVGGRWATSGCRLGVFLSDRDPEVIVHAHWGEGSIARAHGVCLKVGIPGQPPARRGDQ